jgi:hypothetical protein
MNVLQCDGRVVVDGGRMSSGRRRRVIRGSGLTRYRRLVLRDIDE